MYRYIACIYVYDDDDDDDDDDDYDDLGFCFIIRNWN